MASVNYSFVPSIVVYGIIDDTCGLRVAEGTVIRVRIEVLQTATLVKYDIQLTGEAGTREFLEVDLFATLGLAVIEYQNRLM